MVVGIYIVGLILGYALTRIYRNMCNVDARWIDVLITFFFSLLSWACVIVMIICILIKKLEEIDFKIKPPRWL